MSELTIHKRIIYLLHTAVIKGLYFINSLLPVTIASSIGGFLARTFGRFFPASHYATRNLELAMPHLSKNEIKQIVSGMWDNLGRTVMELPFIANGKMDSRITITGSQHFDELRDSGKAAIFVSAHFGNWEILPRLSYNHGIPLVLIYRKINNESLDKTLFNIRAPIYKAMHPKGRKGAASLIRAVQNGSSIAILVDQKMNSGISIPFFGMDSMTAPAVAELSIKYNIPIVMARAIRKPNCRFEAIIEEPFYVTQTGDFMQDVYNAMTSINGKMEGWIRENPEQWFWVHRRWDKKLYL